MNNFTPTIFNFQSTQFDVVDRNGQPWLKGSEVATALGYARPDALNKIYERNKDEFTESMIGHVKMALPGNLETTVRIFSLRGCHLLAMFARTKVAKEFRKWVLDILDKESELIQKPQHLITTDQAGELASLIKERFPDGADRAYAWSRFNNHFRIARYRELPQAKFEEACGYISHMPRKNETKLLNDKTTYNYPRKLLEQSGFVSANGKNPARLNLSMLANTKAFISPLMHLLNEMRADGHDVSAPWDEFIAMREALISADKALEKIYMEALQVNFRSASTAGNK
ncbi:BRO family protein [Nitrosomonas sp.]|uniref:BRO family protein n=1 Tax=Nitrosomonas sp. TaxID=42353 RepID=UPI00343DA118|nr:hypothetical protein [Nitrosomonas sp.]